MGDNSAGQRNRTAARKQNRSQSEAQDALSQTNGFGPVFALTYQLQLTAPASRPARVLPFPASPKISF
jgi:hypothetical protein